MRRALWASAALITSSAILNTAKSLNLSSSLSEENVKNIVAQFVTDSITPLDTLVQRPNDMRTKIELLAMKTQAEMCKALSAEENNATWRVDKWDRKEGGGGVSCIMEDGAVIEKGGVNVSVVHGSLSGPALQNMKSRGHEIFQSPAPFFACGVSCVIHPRNPFVPTIHFNYRYFEVEAGNGRKISWFGGGTDLTPYYLNEKDVVHFHKTLRDACDAERRDEGKFSEYKKWCDKYFFIPHRGESRGVGGIFFDDLTDDPSENTFDFVRRCAESVVPSYLPIVKANKDLPFSKENRDWQLLRRGRYVEFNLVYDRGTKFGLNTPGSRTESILMSLPATANWEYCHSPKVGSPEEKLMKVLKSPKDWV